MTHGPIMMGVGSYAERQAVEDPQCIPTGIGDTAQHTLTMIITVAIPAV